MLQTVKAALLELLLLALAASCAGAQSLKVQSVDGTTVTLTAADLRALPHRVLDVKDPHDGKPLKFDAITLKAVLEKGGVTLGDSLRGKRVSQCLLVEAADGYSAVIALPEIEPEFTSGEVFLADGQDGKPLDARTGPLRTVLPGDKRAARWVRQVTALKIVAVQ